MGQATPKMSFAELRVQINSVGDYSNLLTAVMEVFGPGKDENGKRVWWSSVKYDIVRITTHNSEENKCRLDIVMVKWKRHYPI